MERKEKSPKGKHIYWHVIFNAEKSMHFFIQALNHEVKQILRDTRSFLCCVSPTLDFFCRKKVSYFTSGIQVGIRAGLAT